MKILRMVALVAVAMLVTSCGGSELRRDQLLEKGWLFMRGEVENGESLTLDDGEWQEVIVPHDWAIYGPFDSGNDRQTVAITQNFETEATVKTGRTGGLPYVGVGWYRTRFDVDGFDETKSVSLLFDGAMSEARVWVNGKEACFWAFGYNSFHCDVTHLLNADGKDNLLAVRLENRAESSRWYPGAGLYRNVHVITTDKVHVPIWGTYITTPEVSKQQATVVINVKASDSLADVAVKTRIVDSRGVEVAATDESILVGLVDGSYMQTLTIENPQLWSPESPALYYAETSLYKAGRKVDTYRTRFGVRTIEISPEKGFALNGVSRKIKGVCNHHDLGALGAAVNVAALRRQLTMLKDMGCDAIRTAHNMPAPELVALCDEMGFMMMIEPFDEWNIPKCKNGYHRFFDEWAERDMLNMLHQYRNSPSVVMWSIGNEVPNQCADGGWHEALFLQDICHREDPTRPVTCGMDQVKCIADNGFGAKIDVPGFNYRVHLYEYAYERLPQGFVLGSETSSTISSRGVYKFPVERASNRTYEDQQCSSYDLEHCWWSNIPDEDFAMSDDKPWVIGQFVWTGFDYLGEPTPYDGMWPNHSSMFGIIDLATIPKDRYWLYRSIWNTSSPTLHILPHWTWSGREGEQTPVFVYTSYPSAELFVNGISQGVRSKAGADANNLTERYRLMWNDVRYEAGELKVIAYDADGKAAMERVVRTAGKPYAIRLVADREQITADGKDLAYVRVSIVDEQGNLCPHDGRLVEFEVEGAGKFRAAANGDPTCLDLFHLPKMHAFSGELMAIVQSAERGGKVTLTARAEGVESAQITIAVR